jgi:AcrR family transcriptional regulator
MGATFTHTHLDPAKRAAIINAALKEFALKGFDDASTNVIVKDAGISKGLLFHYFNTKRELFLFLFDYSVDILKREYLEQIGSADGDMIAWYRRAARLKIEIIRRYPYVFDFIGVAALAPPASLIEAFTMRAEDLRAIVASNASAQIDNSKFKPGIDIKRAINIIVWTVEGYEKRAQRELQGSQLSTIDYTGFLADFDDYLNLLTGCFYR